MLIVTCTLPFCISAFLPFCRRRRRRVDRGDKGASAMGWRSCNSWRGGGAYAILGVDASFPDADTCFIS